MGLFSGIKNLVKASGEMAEVLKDKETREKFGKTVGTLNEEYTTNCGETELVHRKDQTKSADVNDVMTTFIAGMTGKSEEEARELYTQAMQQAAEEAKAKEAASEAESGKDEA